MLFDHDLERTLSIRVETIIGEQDLSRLPSEDSKIAIEFGFKRTSLEEENPFRSDWNLRQGIF